MDAREAEAWLYKRRDKRHPMTAFQWTRAQYLYRVYVGRRVYDEDYAFVEQLVERQTANGAELATLHRLWWQYRDYIPKYVEFTSINEYFVARYGRWMEWYPQPDSCTADNSGKTKALMQDDERIFK